MGQSLFIVRFALICVGFKLLLVSFSQQVEVRLTGGRTPFEGRVEVRRDGDNSWRYMCGTGAGWNLTVARAVCKQLGYFTVMWEWSNSEFGRSDLQSSVCDVRCPIMSESLEDCTIDWDNNGYDCQCHDNYHAGITCYYPGFLGRYKEYYDRILPITTSLQIPINHVTIQGCIGTCRDLGKTIAVLESADECYCGDGSVDYWRYGEAIPGLPILPDTQAVQYNTQQCPGDNGTSPYIQGCGGYWQFDVYDTSFGACGGDYTESSGYIYSPNFPGNYTNEQSCTWTITVDPGHIVKLTTLMLRLPDIVIVKDGIEDHSSTISTFTGYSLPQPLYSSSNTLRIEIITNSTGNDLGFVLRFEAIAEISSSPATSTKPSSKVSFVITRSFTQTPTPEVTTIIDSRVETPSTTYATMRHNDVTWSKQPKFITASYRQSSLIPSMKTTGEVCSCCRLCQVEAERGSDGKLIAIGFAIGVTVSLAVTAIVLIVAKVVYQRRRDSTKRHEKGEDVGAYVNADIEVEDSAYTTLQLNEMNQSTYESLNSATRKSTQRQNRDQNE
ncbi:scavenger receptor cysteine-rich domain-containing protein DMBT1-like [Ptychodera flava]|uniref:scavenger receptor cysteine-rich domain-containing protein DMBT1-like n=1 Tax=Ptychodera flava TaxID=63121 RepID=UPI00396A36F1